MTARRRLAKLRDLQQLQRVERDIAGLDHAEACIRADAAQAASTDAANHAVLLAGEWYARRGARHFEPELDILAADGLVRAERNASAAAMAARTAEEHREDTAAAWRLTDARQRGTQRIVRDCYRAALRAEDEGRLDVTAARTLERARRG